MVSNVTPATEKDMMEDRPKSKWTECDNERMGSLVVCISKEENTYSQC